MSAVRCTARGCGWTGQRKAAADLPLDTPLDKGCPRCDGEVKVGGPAPTSVQVTPAGIEIAFWDSQNVESGLEQRRRYAIGGPPLDGHRIKVPSVSTILGVLAKEGLLHWVYRLTLEGRDYRAERDEAGERGAAAHDLVVRAMLGERTSLADLPDEYRGWGRAAYRWLRHRRPEVIAAEQMVASVEYRYAGRFDLLARCEYGLARIDFKTVNELKRDRAGKPYPPYAENALQLDGYEGAARESGYEAADIGCVVRLGPDGQFHETFFELDPDRFLRIAGASRAVREAESALRAGAREAVPA